jgi:predicted DNA-binding transcriptional regulator YafY
VARRAERLFEIIQIVRSGARPITAAALAARLEVTPRTVYRDIAALQAARVPIEGAAGLGYVMRRGYDLPPLMFTAEEVDAIAVGVRLVSRIHDPKLQQAADSVLGKLSVVLPDALRGELLAPPVYVSKGRAKPAEAVALSDIRQAIRDERKMRIHYIDEKGAQTQRTIWPIALAYYIEATLVAAWCELRSDYRHFRADRITSARLLDERYPAEQGKLAAQWFELQRNT